MLEVVESHMPKVPNAIDMTASPIEVTRHVHLLGLFLEMTEGTIAAPNTKPTVIMT